MSPEDIGSEPLPEDFQWVNKLISTAYDKVSPKLGKRIAHLFVGEWVHVEDKSNPDWVKGSFRGGEGYVRKTELGDKNYLEIYFLDVGQGDSILIQTADNRRVLIDGGADDAAHSFLEYKYDLDENPKVFDAVILTHGDKDHSWGLFNILKNPNVIVRNVYHNGIYKIGDENMGRTKKLKKGTMLIDTYSDVNELEPIMGNLLATYRKWCDAVNTARENAKKHNIDLKCIRADHRTPPFKLGADGISLKFLGPINFGSEKSPRLLKYGNAGETINGNSVSIMLEYKQARALLCGDLNNFAEAEMKKRHRVRDLRANLFKANHHGSQHFTTQFLGAVRPWVTVVSSGDLPDYGHPRANLMGSLGRYAPTKIKKPLLFSTELAATFKRLPKAEQKKAGVQLYEKNTEGIIYVRTDGSWLAAGRVYAKKEPKAGEVETSWKWEAYAFNLETAKPLYYKLT